MKKKLLAILLSVSMVASLTACGDSAQSGNAPEELAEDIAAAQEEDEAQQESGDEGAQASDDTAAADDGLNICIASEPDTLDPALNSAVDGATMLVHLFSGLAKWEKDGEGFSVADLLVIKRVCEFTDQEALDFLLS